jgi:hypothetical protein
MSIDYPYKMPHRISNDALAIAIKVKAKYIFRLAVIFLLTRRKITFPYNFRRHITKSNFVTLRY